MYVYILYIRTNLYIYKKFFLKNKTKNKNDEKNRKDAESKKDTEPHEGRKHDDVAKEPIQGLETQGRRWSAIQSTVKKAPRGPHARITAAGTPDAGRAGSRQENSGPAKKRASRRATPRRWRTTPDHHAGAQQGAGAGGGTDRGRPAGPSPASRRERTGASPTQPHGRNEATTNHEGQRYRGAAV